MREILFRGKPIDDKEFLWVNSDGFVYGAPAVPYKTLFYAYYKPYKDDGDYSLVPIEVDSSTVGQFTGLTDKNGKKIFEGDIVKVSSPSGSSYYAVIEYDYGCYWISNPDIQIPDTINNFNMEFVEIIGNIHDNPELL